METSNSQENNVENEDFGLAEVAFKPIERREKEAVKKPENTPFPKQKVVNWPVVIAIVFTVIIVGAGIFFFLRPTSSVPKENELNSLDVTPPVQEQEVSNESVDNTEAINDGWGDEAASTDESNSANVSETADVEEIDRGEILEIKNITGKYFVVIGSFFDKDLAFDQANTLERAGHKVYVIYPQEEEHFYRVGLSTAYNSFNDASSVLESLKNDFGQKIWVLRN
ncbi:SPOR domain-containing protein [Xanthovirga aplysinae]|uniref:SPOR domain-containing protein n=1 Tax=Xanthovirga aplysinae TaxID=2529853 RepID=UPI0012BBFD33|nr:SPOR domain-containing protein [Xanthovirga aplysinae]MTI31171.1 SPOR domain-containing protein [Xanthovirga aplysinae]